MLLYKYKFYLLYGKNERKLLTNFKISPIFKNSGVVLMGGRAVSQ